MTITRTLIARTLALALGASFASAAMAQSTWSSSACSLNSPGGSTYGNSYACSGTVVSGGTAAGTMVNVSAWSPDRGENTGQPITGSAGNWANSYIATYGGGFGAASRSEGIGIGSPDHAFDSVAPGSFDMALLSFDSSVVVSQFGIGWKGSDSDAVVMRWAGIGSPILTNDGTTAVGSKNMLNSTIGSGGWELVNYYLNPAVGNNVSTGADQQKGSSFWLVAAYNTTMSPQPGAGYQGNDAFKLNFLKTTNYTCPGGGGQNPGGGCGSDNNNTPEPGTLALAGLAAAGAFGARRRRSKQVA